ncbi:hypothetical protein CVT24_003137 [Panaeolus cyanescens]|uniref:SnoaL-like domain-containing protein n=1 Tax=Panaeolus cyanescens TaxID=181874 RepID=A0A409WT81_9AGAR|nr:hypothetical protein CVT24_003137 [Panaeolus cyanescens]
MPSAQAVLSSLIESFNTHNKELFLSLAAPGATWWISGSPNTSTSTNHTVNIPHVGLIPYTSHPSFTGPTKLAQSSVTAREVIVDESQRKVVAECVFEGVGGGVWEGKGGFRMDVVLIVELDDEGRILAVRNYADHLALVEFYAKS